ncbi:MAG: DNA polymerase III subunit alpha [Deltaproteobacteria bacterium]|nr:DNA polymerase III subunit alpha [Deltaproteobacteria bacterium]
MSFISLHVHTHYSLLESTVKVPDLVARAKEFAMPAVAVADLGNMFGAVDFYFAAKAAGIKPIVGAEIFYVTGSRLEKTKPARRVQMDASASQDARLFHLVLLCKNAEGYRNLCELVTKGYSEGFLGKPRVDRESLLRHREGLVALTAGLKGELAYHVASGRPDRAEEALAWLRETYRDDLYLEIQENGIPEQAAVNRFLADSAKKLGVPLVAAAETFYLKPEQAVAQEVLMCIGAGRTLDEARGVRLVPDEFWFKDEATVTREFAWAPEAISNTALAAAKCDFTFKLKDEKGKQIYHLPDFRPTVLAAGERFSSEKFSVEQELREQASRGLEGRFVEPSFEPARTAPGWAAKKKTYEARLQEELDMIVRTGFSGYFLVVADFIGFAKSKGIPVGPGRGSGAGSIVAWALKITDVDPIPLNLLFERFINPERISLPDFDIDFCQNRRQEVIDYVVGKYGRDKVSQIATFGKLLAKGVVRDVSRVMGYSFSDVDPIAKLIPEELGMTLESAFEREQRLRELIEKDPRAARLFEIARLLEGLNRHVSVHAAGVVITNRPLTEYCPLFTGKEGEAVIQYDKDFAEKVGLVKFDFLGLKTLTVIDNAVKFVRETQLEKGAKEPELFRLDRMSYADPEVYKLISSGDTDGIFQLESSGMKDLCSRVQPGNLEDITAINALYRPGPLNSGMVDDFINRKHGVTPVTYELPQLKGILEETYGVIVYQEQVMRVARVLAGYTLGEADILRRAMGKKKKEEMDKQREKFVQGCAKNSEGPIPAETANRIFDLLAKFAEYGFNKSHSAAYGVLSYQTAYMKRHYPAQFMAAMLATEMHDTDKMSQYLGDARLHGIAVLPPDVNASKKTFSVVERDEAGIGIRFGMEAIKGVGGVAVDAILAERESKGPFKGFIDFCARVPLRKVNKKVLESLISSGAFDSVAEENRATLFESVEAVIDHSSKLQEQADLGQVSFFDQYKPDSFKLETSTGHLFKRVPDWGDSKKLQMEKQLVGFYVSGHPMDKWWQVAKNFVSGDLTWIIEQFPAKKEASARAPKETSSAGSFKKGSVGKGGWRRDEGPRWDIVTAALVGSFREITTKKGSRMAFVEFEDARAKIEAVCFPEAYEQFGALIRRSVDECLPFVITGNVALDEETPKIFIRSIDPVSEFQKRRVSQVIFRLDPSQVDAERLALLRAAIVRHRGKCATYLEYAGAVSGTEFSSRHALPQELFVNPSADFVKEVNALFGEDVVKFG